ncbi:MAG: GNAT family N-acetyltransferase [Caulobacterales bacterium]|nr:GNAT family N-acetyltransferase [Caulobacterales bacterium]
MADTITLRPARAEDGPALADIFAATRPTTGGGPPSDPDASGWWCQEMLLPDSDVTVAEFGGAVIAFAAVRDGFLQQVCVRADHQRHAIGGALLSAAKDAHPGGLFAYVSESEPDAIRFLERHGFITVGVRDRPYDVRSGESPDRALRWRPV